MELPNKVAYAEKALAKAFAEILRASGYERSEDLVYAMSVLIDRDLWVLMKLAELGIENLVKKLVERDLSLVLEFSDYTVYLTFAWFSATSAVLHIVENYKRENVNTLTSWSRTYAEEVEDYLDTMDVLLDDEAFGEILGLEDTER